MNLAEYHRASVAARSLYLRLAEIDEPKAWALYLMQLAKAQIRMGNDHLNGGNHELRHKAAVQGISEERVDAVNNVLGLAGAQRETMTIMPGLDAAQRAYDRMTPDDDEQEYRQHWTPVFRTEPTDEDVECLIVRLAETGRTDDELGFEKTQPSIYRAVAEQWVTNKEAIGPIIGPEFWKWAKSCAFLAIRGKF